MNNALKILCYFLGTLILGALLAPPLFWAGHALGGRVHSLRWLQETDFQRYFNRAMFLAALVLLWPTVRALRVGNWRDLGFRWDGTRDAGRLVAGFILAGAMLWLLGIFLWQRGIYIPNPKGMPPVGILCGFLLTALVVGALEEAFFRGALLGLVRRNASPTVALWFIAGLFAALHFLKPESGAKPTEPITWVSGFVLLPSVFWQWSDPLLVLGGFLTLLLVGLILGWARLRTGSLALPIGLHAGWIFGLKSFGKASKHIADPDVWFGDNLLIGVGPLLTLTVTGAIIWMWLRARASESDHLLPPT